MGGILASIGGGDRLGVAIVEIGADVSKYEKALGRSEDKLKLFDKKTAEAARTVGMALTGIGAAAVGMSAVAARQFATFEQTMANVASVSNATGEEFQQLSDFARKLGETTVFTATQAGEGMYYLASAGYNAGQQMKATSAILDLAAATQSGLSEATQLTVSALKSFHLPAEEAGRATNVFAATISSSQATLERLSVSMPYVGATFNNLGWSVESAAAALGILYDNGLEASMAGTRLRSAINDLLNPSDKATAALKELGISVEDVSPATHSLVEIVSRFEEAGLDAASAVKIFGERAEGMVILSKAGAAALTEMEEKITGTNRAAEMAARQLDTLTGDLKLFKSAVEGAAISFGEKLSPAIRTAAGVLTDLTNVFANLPEPMQKVIAVSTAAGGAIALMGGSALLMVGYLPRLIQGFTLLGTAMAGAKFAAIASAITPIAAILAGVAAGVGLVAVAIDQYDRSRKNAFGSGAKADEANVRGMVQAVGDYEEAIEALNSEINKSIGAGSKWTDEHIVKAQEKLEGLKRRLAETKQEVIAYADASGTASPFVAKLKEELAGTTKAMPSPATVQNVGNAIGELGDEAKTASISVEDLKISFEGFPAIFKKSVRPTTDEWLAALTAQNNKTRETMDLTRGYWAFLGDGPRAFRQYAEAHVDIVDWEYDTAAETALRGQKIMGKIDEDEGKARLRETIQRMDVLGDTTTSWHIEMTDEEKKYWQEQIAIAEVGLQAKHDAVIWLDKQVWEIIQQNQKDSWGKSRVLYQKHWDDYVDETADGINATANAWKGLWEIWNNTEMSWDKFHKSSIGKLTSWVDKVADLLNNAKTIWQSFSTVLEGIAKLFEGGSSDGLDIGKPLGSIIGGSSGGASLLGKIGGGIKSAAGAAASGIGTAASTAAAWTPTAIAAVFYAGWAKFVGEGMWNALTGGGKEGAAPPEWQRKGFASEEAFKAFEALVDANNERMDAQYEDAMSFLREQNEIGRKHREQIQLDLAKYSAEELKTIYATSDALRQYIEPLWSTDVQRSIVGGRAGQAIVGNPALSLAGPDIESWEDFTKSLGKTTGGLGTFVSASDKTAQSTNTLDDSVNQLSDDLAGHSLTTAFDDVSVSIETLLDTYAPYLSTQELASRLARDFGIETKYLAGSMAHLLEAIRGVTEGWTMNQKAVYFNTVTIQDFLRASEQSMNDVQKAFKELNAMWDKGIRWTGEEFNKYLPDVENYIWGYKTATGEAQNMTAAFDASVLKLTDDLAGHSLTTAFDDVSASVKSLLDFYAPYLSTQELASRLARDFGVEIEYLSGDMARLLETIRKTTNAWTMNQQALYFATVSIEDYMAAAEAYHAAATRAWDDIARQVERTGRPLTGEESSAYVPDYESYVGGPSTIININAGTIIADEYSAREFAERIAKYL